MGLGIPGEHVERELAQGWSPVGGLGVSSLWQNCKQFANDMKLYSNILSREDWHGLQQDLNSLAAWFISWLLKVNEAKCVVVNIRADIDYWYS